jgi:hypothetical protein
MYEVDRAVKTHKVNQHLYFCADVGATEQWQCFCLNKTGECGKRASPRTHTEATMESIMKATMGLHRSA